MIIGYNVFEKGRKVDLEPRGTFPHMFAGFYYLKSSAETFIKENTSSKRRYFTVPVDVPVKVV